MKLTMMVCDVCQDKALPTTPYEIRSEGKKVSVDLCEAHSQPVAAFLAQAPKPVKRGPQKGTQRRARGGGQINMTDMGDVK